MKRLPRTPVVPDLHSKDIEHITSTVFFTEPASSNPNVIFVFGYNAQKWDYVLKAATLYPNATIVTTGDRGPGEKSVRYQGLVIRNYLVEHGIDPKRIIVEQHSTNTLENVLNGLKLLRKHNITPKHILFCSKHHHSGRCYRTLKKYAPGVELSNWWQESSYSGRKVTKERWHTHTQGKQRVYGEYLRIKKYSKKGDISE